MELQTCHEMEAAAAGRDLSRKHRAMPACLPSDSLKAHALGGGYVDGASGVPFSVAPLAVCGCVDDFSVQHLVLHHMVAPPEVGLNGGVTLEDTDRAMLLGTRWHPKTRAITAFLAQFGKSHVARTSFCVGSLGGR